MWTKRPQSLRKLLLIHEIAFIILVLVSGLLGGFSAYFWQQYSVESDRLNNLIFANEQIRSELFRQLQEAIRARLLEDAQALELYGVYSRSIDQQFAKLRQNAVSAKEIVIIDDLHSSYREIQKDMNKIFTDPYVVSRQVRMKIIDPRFAQAMVGKFEGEYFTMKKLMISEHEKLDAQLDKWTRYAPVVVVISLLLAFAMVIYARLILRRHFLQPMQSVLEGTQVISQGRLDFKIPNAGVIEITMLANTINSMASDLHASRNALIESERQAALGALIPVIAHNIRNPLASIRATAQVLEDVDDKEELKESQQAILETIDRLGRWVNSLVSYLHPLKPNYRLIYAAELVNAALSLLTSRIESREITVIKSGWEDNQRLNADPDLMEQALYALIANAVDASPHGSKLEIKFIKLESNLEMHIIDQGGGLPFNPEPNNLTPGPTTKRFGTGLGIPIAFKICQKHGWKLSFNIEESKSTSAVITAPLRVHEEEVKDAGQ